MTPYLCVYVHPVLFFACKLELDRRNTVVTHSGEGNKFMLSKWNGSNGRESCGVASEISNGMWRGRKRRYENFNFNYFTSRKIKPEARGKWKEEKMQKKKALKSLSHVEIKNEICFNMQNMAERVSATFPMEVKFNSSSSNSSTWALWTCFRSKKSNNYKHRQMEKHQAILEERWNTNGRK